MYDPATLEKKWQAYWEKNQTFKAKDDKTLKKAYILDMYPYPSGAGLHVGHLVGYTATDVISRYKWQKGLNVLHPMGWDSFGLPAEQYALRTGTHPAVTTKVNIARFKEQLKTLGYAYDWEREFATTDPSFYKWTQWIFTKLYEKGLAYQAEMLVNYCPALCTVLANEEIENGLSKEGGHPVEKRPLRQWILKITDYADRLSDDLESLDWPDSLKRLQRNWIGRSEGALIDFASGHKTVSVFTTSAETLNMVTYLVLAPDHPLVDQLVSEGQKEVVVAYQKETATKSDVERAEHAKHKSGVFLGAYAEHPLTGEKLPIWIGDYVLSSYGTGAVMGVPSLDERDREFAEVYGLPIIDQEPLDKTAVIGELEKKGKGKSFINYKLRDWLFSRQRYWGEPIPIVHFEDGSMRALELDELPLMPPEMTDFKPNETGESPLSKQDNWVNITDSKTGNKVKRETNTMPQWAGSSWYYLRFADPHNSGAAWGHEAEKYWLPVDLYVGGAEHAVLHLLYARFWHKVLYDLKLVSTPEPFQKLCNQGLVVSRSFKQKNGLYITPEEVVEKEGKYFHWETNEPLVSHIEKMSKSKLNGQSPDEIVEEFGADAVRLYMLFMSPIEKEKVWNSDAITGPRRFLGRFYDMATSDKVKDEPLEVALKLVHKLIHGVSEDLEKMLFNTAIAKMMEFINAFTALSHYPKNLVLKCIQLLAPFAPHLCEELWERLGQTGSVTHSDWPKADPAYLTEESVTYVVQVNGRLRGRFELPKDKSKEEILTLAQAEEGVSRFLIGRIVKVVFVPNKLLNIVVK